MHRRKVGVLALGALAVAGLAFMWSARPAAPERLVGAVCRSRAGDERRTCYVRLLVGYLNKYGVARAVETLDSLAAADPEVAQHAHEYAHGIGMMAYDHAPDIATTFVDCGDGAASGCRHGFMQAYFQQRKQLGAADVRGLCQPLEAGTFNRALRFQCFHGMGHGLTMFRGHDAPRALKDCDLLETEWSRVSCYEGVFMEAFINATASHHASTSHDPAGGPGHGHGGAYKAIDPADPLYPCSIMEQRYLFACYHFQTTVILHLNGGDIPAAARECDRAPADMRLPCYESLGRDVIMYASRDPKKTAQLCAGGNALYRSACYSAAARALVNWTGTPDDGLALCRVVAGRGPEHANDATECYTGLGVAIAALFVTPEERDRACARAPAPGAVAACRRGAQSS
jgi:hypothetical protein